MTEKQDGPERFRTPTTDIVAEAGVFLSGFKTLLMATVSGEGVPDASYAPFVRLDDDAFYVNLSGLSTHTGNLLANPRVSILFLQSEDDTNQLFARKRLSFDADAHAHVLIETEGAGNRQVVHYGGDSGNTAGYRKGTLYFHHNTIVSHRTDRTTLMRLSTNDEHCDARNNLVYASAAGGDTISLLDASGVLDWTSNWIEPAPRPCPRV